MAESAAAADSIRGWGRGELRQRLSGYDEAFRREAVRLWKSSGKSAEITARELGISVFQLYEWNRGAGVSRAADSARLPDLKTTSKEELQDEVERLQRELTRVTEQRDILKKAAGILSEPSPSGIPGFKLNFLRLPFFR